MGRLVTLRGANVAPTTRAKVKAAQTFFCFGRRWADGGHRHAAKWKNMPGDSAGMLGVTGGNATSPTIELEKSAARALLRDVGATSYEGR